MNNFTTFPTALFAKILNDYVEMQDEHEDPDVQTIPLTRDRVKDMIVWYEEMKDLIVWDDSTS